MKIAVTGATGFVGNALCPHLEQRLGAGIIAINRNTLNATNEQLVEILKGADCLVHLAARAHAKNTTAQDFERDNQALSQRIATLAVAARIPRVVYLSSIKVNGESTQGRAAFTTYDLPAPVDDYGKSKLACEEIFRRTCANSNTQLVIIRPPLVYGSNNKGNLAALERLIHYGIPLPFAGIHNKRDLVSVANLCSLISHCCIKAEAAGHTFMVSDGIGRSTADIVKLLAQQMQKPVRLFKLPSIIFNLLALIKPDAITRLTGDLEVDISKTQSLLGWSPQ